jgi:hypothetical protein
VVFALLNAENAGNPNTPAARKKIDVIPAWKGNESAAGTVLNEVAIAAAIPSMTSGGGMRFSSLIITRESPSELPQIRPCLWDCAEFWLA